MRFLNRVALIGAAIAGLCTPAAAQDYSWDMPNSFGRNSSDGVADVVFGELVTEKTDGAVAITHHFDGSLGYRGVDHLTAVQDGAVQLARHPMSYYGGYDPIFLLSTLPFLIEKDEDVSTMHEVIAPYVDDAFESYDQIVVSYGLFPPSGIWSKEPIDSLDDLKGLKIRAFDLNSLQTFSGAGAAAVNMNWGDVLPALSTGAIDAVVTSADLGFASGIYEYLPNFTEINWAVPLSTVAINRDVWEGLPEEIQTEIMEAGAETTTRTFERLTNQVAENYAGMREAGVAVKEEAPADVMAALREAATPVIDDWRERAGDNAQALDAYLEAVGR